MTHATYDDVESAAKELAGNHRKFDSFAWFERPDDDENWAIVYTHNRDSGLLDQSNAAAIEKELWEQFRDSGDIHSESHSHWACGWIEGYAIRVYDNTGRITDCFRKWCELSAALADYPVLDDEDYSRREYDATIENLTNNRPRNLLVDLPDGWEGDVFSWLWDHNQGAIENRDDQGGYAKEEEIIEALLALGIITTEDIDE